MSSSEVLTCETAPGIPGTYLLAVSTGDGEPASIYGFTYSNDLTPNIKAIYPRAGPPGSQIFLVGDNTWTLQWSMCTETTWGEINCIGSIMFGDYLCPQDLTDPESVINFANWTGYQRYGYNPYRVGCTLPAPETVATLPSLGTAGSFNATMRFEASLRGGSAQVLRPSYAYDVNGTPYHFQLYPEVSSIEPSVGSVAGGTLIKITGRGFPTLDLKLDDVVNVSIAGVPCTIVNSTYDTVFCVSGPKPALAPESAAPIAGLYPGMRGIEYEFYNMSSSRETPTYSNLWRLNKTILTTKTNGTGSYKATLAHGWEDPNHTVSYHCTRFKAFFTAPRSAKYRFYVQNDDYGQLNGTWIQDGIELSRMLVNLSYWTPVDTFFYYSFQGSVPIYLEAAHRILLESAHCNGPSVGSQQVAVRMEVPEPVANSIAKVQTITVTSSIVPHAVLVKFLYGAGANTTAFFVNVTSLDDSKLDDPLLGMQLIFNDGNVTAVFPVTANSAAIDDAIEAAFGGQLAESNSNDLFGVRKVRSQGSISLQIGINAIVGDANGFDVTGARLVMISKAVLNNVTAPSTRNCTWRYPPPASAAASPPPPPGISTSNIPGGLMVTVTQAQPVPAVVPSGDFEISLPTTATPFVLNYETNATVMQQTIYNLTKMDCSVTLTNTWREGVYFARVWTVTFSSSVFDNVPTIVVQPTDTMAPGTLIAVERRRANPPLTGSFAVAYGDYCESVSIGLTDSVYTIADKLATLPGMGRPQKVESSGGSYYGYTFIITFDPFVNPGDEHTLRVVDLSGLTGVRPIATVANTTEGSTDAFYGPIPTEFLQLAVSEPGTISLSVNGAPSACTHPSGMCKFEYSEAATPLITSVSPATLSFNTESSLPLTITGTQFDAGLVNVTVGAAICNVTSVSATQIVCSVSDDAPAGVRLVNVNVAGLGNAAGARNVTIETLYVTGVNPSPALVASSGLSILNITGKGFDEVQCANNKVLIDDDECGVLACGPTFLTVLYTGNAGADVASAAITAQVYEAGRLIDVDVPASPTVAVSGAAPTITGITSPDTMPGAGGTVTVSLTGAGPADVAAMHMVPWIPSPTNYTAAHAAYQGRIACPGVTAVSGAEVSCTAPGLPNGNYQVLVVLKSGLRLLSTETILFDLVITSVSPNWGSIGGGTVVTIRGAGFSMKPADNVVFLQIPVSTTFLNGIIQCDTTSVTPTELTCITRAHLATNADGNDPTAKQVMPEATNAQPVSVVLCNTTYYNSTVLKEYCWSLASSPHARIATARSDSCDFGYSEELTPAIDIIWPAKGAAGVNLQINGSFFSDVTAVQMMQGGAMRGLCTDVIAFNGTINCTTPDLPSGIYTLLLLKDNGEKSVDAFVSGVFTYRPTITALDGNAGSLVGGRPLTLTVGGSGLATGDGNFSANAVDIAGMPCPLISVDSRWSLTCRAPGMNGYVYAEYWNLASGTYTLPDLLGYSNPGEYLVKLEKGVWMNWDWASPKLGVVQTDFFGARFTFYMQIAETSNASFYMSCDDSARLYIDGELIGSSGWGLPTTLQPGVRKFVITFVEWTGTASIKLYVSYVGSNGYSTGWQQVEWSKVTPVAPGAPLPIGLTVNGVAADPACPPSTVQLQLPYRQPLSYEPSSVPLSNGTCAYVYTTHMTPTLVAFRGMPNGVSNGPMSNPNATLSVYGDFFLDPSIPATDQLSIMVANESCPIFNVTQVTVNGTTIVMTFNSTAINSTNTTATTYAAINVTKIDCAIPALVVGTWPVRVLVSGLGYTRPPANVATDLPTVPYKVQVTGITSPVLNNAGINNDMQCYGSLFGGMTLTVGGYGYVRGFVDTDLQRNFTLVWDQSTCSSTSQLTPTCQAAKAAAGFQNYTLSMPFIPVTCDGATAVFRLGRIAVASPEGYAGATSGSKVVLNFKPRVYYMYPNSPQYNEAGSSSAFSLCGARTPVISAVSPASPASPDVGADGTTKLALTWFLAGVGSNYIVGTAAGARSNATVELEAGPTLLNCTDVTVVSSSIKPTNYSESVRCTLPRYLPAAVYRLWVCIPPFGCGLQYYTVNLAVSSAAPLVGGSAGGTRVTVTGNGFDTNASRVAVRFGSSICNVTSSTATSLTCVTGPLAAKPDAVVTAPLSIVPTIGAGEFTYSAYSFALDPSLEAAVSSVTPARGSTEGGTPVTITGVGFALGAETTVTVGGTPCTSVNVVSSTSITCTTGKPPSDVLRVPLPLVINQAGRGYARGNVSYQYIDLWSRNSTWGNGPLPGYEDSVVIPPGVTVLLDMSPPKLFTIVLQGNLVFDDTLPYINLQAHYILVVGGNFSIGTVEKPFPGRANITMHGPPNSRDLPLYGAKAIAIRNGVVTFHGQHKVPHYTVLNQTANQGETAIVLNGQVNWQVGDRIVVAPSGFHPDHVDEATITAVDLVTRPGCSVLYLDTPLKYDHLGVIHTQDGLAPLDMRAEVGVLTRNVVLMGDWTSEANMYGVQVMAYSPPYLPRALIRFDNIEVTQSGQAYRLGRYSIHWHVHGDVNFQSWVRGCSIHHTYNRATTIHGTHRSLYQNNLAYNVMGHTFFMEDGNEWGNVIEGNIGIYTKASYALLITDTTPATFWITNPNNTVRHNRAIGSEAYGFWYRHLDNPEGPGYSPTICPKFTQLGEFYNNSAHSNIHYGFRIHPEYYPRNVPCNGFNTPFAQVPAVFDTFSAYKNGVKGAVATQVGLVQFRNFVLGDNGGGPKQHATSGKDNGANAEISWVVDDRNRYDTALSEMSGLHNATLYARTDTGRYGTAGDWPSGRYVTGVIAQSPLMGHQFHSALMSLVNVTFVDYTSATGMRALEHCGKCKKYQGGATCFTAGLQFISTSEPSLLPSLAGWTWGHQGIFLDTDGTLLNENTLPASMLPTTFSLGPGSTLHSTVESELFDPAECVYSRDAAEGDVVGYETAFCSPLLVFRRVMLHEHGPDTLFYKPLRLTSLSTNRTSLVHFTKYNEQGYQFTVATTRDYWVHWELFYRLDPEYYTLHKLDLMDGDDMVMLTSKYIQRKDHFTINSAKSNLTDFPLMLPSTPHGSFYYQKNFTNNSWWWGNFTYNDTKFSVVLAGRTDGTLRMASYPCPDEGCNTVPEVVVDVRNGTLYWSNATTWAKREGGKPQAGENVTIPYGWDLVIDESPPALTVLLIQGNVRFDPTRDIELSAVYILVMGDGALRAGSPSVPHPTAATVKLVGARAVPDYAIDNSLNLGSKVLAAIRGGTIELHGRKVAQRWIRLAAPAAVNDDNITVSDPNHGWRAGDLILISSNTYNVWQTEIRNISAVRNGGATLVLDAPLLHPHASTFKSYPGGPTVDMRAEVGLLSSNVLVTASNGFSSHAYGSEFFGARILVHGNSTGRFTGMAVQHCGQAGLTNRACILFDRLKPVFVPVNATSNTTVVAGTYQPNPSTVFRSSIAWGTNYNLKIAGLPGAADPIRIEENVMYEALDAHSVEVLTSGNVIKGNLVLGTIKDMSGGSTFDIKLPSQFRIAVASNWVENNVAAGGERLGYTYYGVPCSEPFLTGSFLNNTAHSNLAGLWLQASDESSAEGCTALRNFTTYMNWDFGIISTGGITTDVRMVDVNVLDNKHAGVTLLRKGLTFAEKANLWWTGGLLAGQSSPAVCAACTKLSDIGCHQKLSTQSYNRIEPFTPAIGLYSAQFALHFSDGPEVKPWDKPKSYSIAHGMMNISGVTLADYYGPAGCGGADVGTYAFANHPYAPDAGYPHFFSRMNVLNVATGAGQGMFKHSPPDPIWRNEGDCWDTYYTRPDGSKLALNCAGPAHVYWRDLDGTLLGGGDPANAGIITGVWKEGPRSFPYDQGPPVLPGACTYSSAIGSYMCAVKSTNFLLDERLKPNPIPPNGIYGDPQHFVLESRDKDSEDRMFAPVFFNVSGSIDLAVSAMDQGCCFGYGFCQKRLSTFWTHLPSWQTVYVNFTGTPSQNFRVFFPYADPSAELVLVINMLYTLNRRFIYLSPGNGPVSGRVPPEKSPVKIGDGTGHGAHYWDQDNSLLYVKVKGGKQLEIRTENAVIISQSFAISIDAFYSTAELFLTNLASAMGIEPERMYIAKVVPGSVTISTAIGPKWSSATEIAEPTYGSEFDPANPPPAPPPAAPATMTMNPKEMLDAVLAYMAVVSDPNAAALIGVQPLGKPVSDLGALLAQDPLLAQALANSLAAAGMEVTGVVVTLESPPPPASTDAPTAAPTETPTSAPKDPATPTEAPTTAPTTAPTGTPTTTPTAQPTTAPTASPTASPTSSPTTAPTTAPTGTPTAAPTEAPTGNTPTEAPIVTVKPGAPGEDPVINVPDRASSPPPPDDGAADKENKDKDKSKKIAAAAAAAAGGALIIGGVVAAAFVVSARRKRRFAVVDGAAAEAGGSSSGGERRYRDNEVLPSPGPGPVRSSNNSHTSSTAREAFVSTNPAYESPREQAPDLAENPLISPRPGSATAVGRTGSVSGVGRHGSASGANAPHAAPLAHHAEPLSAGLTSPEPAEMIRPLASTSKHPHSKPLVPVSGSSLFGSAPGNLPPPEVYHRGRTKAPAELQRSESSGLARQSAPGASSFRHNLAGRENSIRYAPSERSRTGDASDSDGSDVDTMALPIERAAKSVTERVTHGVVIIPSMPNRPSSARPATRNPDRTAKTARRVRLEPLESAPGSSAMADAEPAAKDPAAHEIVAEEPASAAGLPAIEPAAAAAATAAALNQAPRAPGSPTSPTAFAESSGAAAAAAAAEPALPPAPVSGETLVMPVRSLETQESFIPRPRSRAATATGTTAPSRRASAAAEAAAHMAGAVSVTDDDMEAGGPAAMPALGRLGSPTAGAQPAHGAAEAPRPMMMLPGGLMEYAATPSLLRSEVAALLLSAGGGAEGFAALEEALQEAQSQQQQAAGTPQARSPAGLYSESMRKRMPPGEQ
ncbi:hypothetical protein GPECTOR_77g37 [Gonium pectorale]|uniref:Fibrocystin-L n=1 Tax=Gonium pectorale TaxID=33097 RepID=A0A150G2A4_GONPE|nr:hypothetical protein GPECTOR_77g37 [Gonium pectorale]|eukprot:KXZ43941.1 hypothetical protein GPECTOR_77g37 [Gonium pectorale]